jgi:hypothetical protein
MATMLQIQPDAVRYSVPQALERFVPPAIWRRVREPAHRVLCGGRGTGKTMLLKRLSWPAMIAAPDYLPGKNFVAFYFNARELTDLQLLFSDVVFRENGAILANARAICACMGTLHLLHVIGDTLLSVPNDVAGFADLSSSLIATANRVLSPILTEDFKEVAALSDFLEGKKADLIAAVGASSRLQREAEYAQLVTPPEQTFRLFASKTRRSFDWPIGLLIDQYEWLPMQSQVIFNPLLKRENAAHFHTVVACLNFAFNPALDVGSLQPGDDFAFTLAEYLPHDHDQYEALLASIWRKLKPECPPLDCILQGGITFLAGSSARSIRRFLELVAEAGALEATRNGEVSEGLQRGAAERVSKAFRDELKVATGVPQGDIWNLILAIRKLSLLPDQAEPRLLPYTISLSCQQGTAADRFSSSATILVKKAFEEGALHFLNEQDISVVTIPERFTLASILGPSLSCTFDYNRTLELSNVRDRGGECRTATYSKGR